MSDAQIAITSAVYNLAGDESKRLDYLKSLILGGVVQGADSLGDVITKGYRGSPALKLRRFLKWAKEDPEFISNLGGVTGAFETAPTYDLEVVKAAIPHESDVTLTINSVSVGKADVGYWVKRYMAQTYPNGSPFPLPYLDYYYAQSKIYVEFFDGQILAFDAPDFVQEAQYLYVDYTPTHGEILGNITYGVLTTLPSGQEFPVLESNWRVLSETATKVVKTLKTTETVDVTYSDNRPAEHYSMVTEKQQTVTETHGVYEKEEYQGAGPDPETQVYSLRSTQTRDLVLEVKSSIDAYSGSVVLEGGVTRTTITGIETEYFSPKRTYQINVRNIIHHTHLPQQHFIYRKDSIVGSPLNALFHQAVPVDAGAFYPPIPFRYEGASITKEVSVWFIDLPLKWDFLTYTNELWLAPHAGATNRAIQVLHAETVDDTGGADGATFKYSAYGWKDAENTPCLISDVLEKRVAPVMEMRGLNSDGSQWKSGWLPLKGSPQPDPDAASSLAHLVPFCKKAFRKAFDADYEEVQNQILRNENINDIDFAYAIFGTCLNVEDPSCRKYIFKFFEHLMQTTSACPTIEEIDWWTNFYTDTPQLHPWKSLQLSMQHSGTINYKTDIRWAFITPSWGTGLAQVPNHMHPEFVTGYRDAKVGEVWFHCLGPCPAEIPEGQRFMYQAQYKLLSDTSFNDRVEITWQITEDSWKKLTITGLHFRNWVYKDKFSLLTASQALLSEEEAGFIIPLHETLFNELRLVEQTQMSTACMVLVFNCYEKHEIAWYQTDWFKVVTIAVVVIVAVAAAIWTGGSSLGLLGSALSVGTSLGLAGTTAIIVGAAVNALAGLMVAYLLQAVSTSLFGEEWGGLIGAVISIVFSMGMGAAANGVSLWDTLSSAQCLIPLSCATIDGVSQFLQQNAQEIRKEMQRMLENGNEELEKIQKLINELDPSNRLDPTIVNQFISELTEKPQQFLARTLMTGSDIVELTLDAVHEFTDRQLHLALP